MKARKQLEPVPERTGSHKTSKVFASVLILASALCHAKDPRKKRKMRHEGTLCPIAGDSVIHQGTKASDHVKRRRGGMIARKHVVQRYGGHEPLRATVAQPCSAALAVVNAVGVQPLEYDPPPEVACFISRSDTKPLRR